jgi:hypothetical protein
VEQDAQWNLPARQGQKAEGNMSTGQEQSQQSQQVRKIVLVRHPRMGTYQVKQTTNFLLYGPGDRITEQQAQKLIEEGMTVIVAAK